MISDSNHQSAPAAHASTGPPSGRHGLALTLVMLLGLAPALPAQTKTTAPAAAEETATADTATTPADIATVSSPSWTVQQLHTALLEAMQNAEQLGYQGRYEKLKPVISALFDTPLISKVILSRYWNDLSEAQQSGFIELFNRLSTATYASRFDGYDGEEFREVGVKELRKGRQLVQTELLRANKKPVRLDYLVHHTNGEWRIISVIADGVNDLSLKRAEYAVVIKDKGYDGLLKDIQSKIREMEAEP